jgi:hypothetical protein
MSSAAMTGLAGGVATDFAVAAEAQTVIGALQTDDLEPARFGLDGVAGNTT